jgi:hypothetical protein
MREIWKHYPGYLEARSKVRAQSLEADLRLIDDLQGRANLRYGDNPEDVKAEALRQLEIDWRSERNEAAEFYVAVAEAQRGDRQ